MPAGSLLGHALGQNTWEVGRDSQATPPSAPFHRSLGDGPVELKYIEAGTGLSTLV